MKKQYKVEHNTLKWLSRIRVDHAVADPHIRKYVQNVFEFVPEDSDFTRFFLRRLAARLLTEVVGKKLKGDAALLAACHRMPGWPILGGSGLAHEKVCAVARLAGLNVDRNYLVWPARDGIELMRCSDRFAFDASDFSVTEESSRS